MDGASSGEKPATSNLQAARETMAPHLGKMWKDIKTQWPEMDPELMLVHWLCLKHDLEPPKGSLVQKTVLSPRVPSQPPSAQNVASPPRPARTLVHRGEEIAIHQSDVEKQVESRAIADSSCSTSFLRCAEEGYDGTVQNVEGLSMDQLTPSAPSPCLSARLRHRRDENKEVQLEALKRVTQRVEADCKTLNVRSDQFKRNMDDITMRLATMRQEVRGKFVSNVPLLSLEVLNLEEQFWLVGKLRPWNVEAGESIVTEGEIGDKLFIIELGTCEVWKMQPQMDTDYYVNTKICEIEKGDFFGEMAVMYDMPRSATVKAVTPVTLLSLSREDLFSSIPAEKIERMKILARAQVFSNVPLLTKLDTQIKVLIARKLRADVWEPGSVILRENLRMNGPQRRIYLVEKGQCLCSQMDPQEDDREGKRGKLSRKRSVFLSQEKTCQAGAYFGMFEFLYGCPQLNSLKALTECVTLSISYDEMKDLLSKECADGGDEIFISMRRAVRIHMIREAHALLKNASEKELLTLLASAKSQRYKQWDTVLRKGENLNQLSLLEEGCCIEYDGSAEDLMEATCQKMDVNEHSRPGESFGTKAVVGKKKAEAPFTLVAVSEVSILHISKESINGLPRFGGNSLLPKVIAGSHGKLQGER